MNESPQSIVLTLAYDGTAFRGWQRLPGAGRTVQEAVENALVAISGQGLPVSGASRTDGGVHASGQCAMFRSAKVPEPDRLLSTLNKALPQDVACLGLRTAVHNFDPRYRATAKTYIYRLHDGAHPDKTAGRYSCHVDAKLDDEAMIAALELLAGEHDYSAFTNAKPALVRGSLGIDPGKGGMRGAGNDGRRKPGKEFTRHLSETRLERKGSLIGLVFKGDGFLYNQVRIMAATIVECGAGRMAPADIARLLQSGDRGAAPGALSARGLRLAAVEYRESDFLSGYVSAGAAPGNAEGQPPAESLAGKPFLRYVLRQP
ncbi:MAG: tRNA pseudouridine synthase A [Spirochaetia bacterium]|jgi:tRNA pseudouridine38-40 synthase|nr:tRNA pseudouridine synthase A [Spirochaetia bacterium]